MELEGEIMKRRLSPLLIIILFLLLVGCSNEVSEEVGENNSGPISEPIVDEDGERIIGTWKANYKESTVVLAVRSNGTYELYQKKGRVTFLTTGTYTDANDTLALTPIETKQNGEGEFDFEDTSYIPYTLDGNRLNTIINNQDIQFQKETIK